MREIGGYFGLEELAGQAYHGDLVAVNSGRNALAYLLRARRIRKLYIPFFLCDSVARLCEREGCDYDCYHLTKAFQPAFEKKLERGEYLYLVNYYGQLPLERQWKERYGQIIVDNVQAFFRRAVAGVDTVYSCRKFFGVPDGGYVATDAPALPLEEDCSRHRMEHVLGRYEDTASAYYGVFAANDERFYDLELRAMSRLTRNILRAVDYAAVKRRREENFAALHRLLGERNPLPVTLPEGPYAYPFYVEGGMAIKRELAAQKIYVPTLWPNVLELKDTAEGDLAENILPLPCDQRYDRTDMEELARQVLGRLK